jgi:hypothetical protein
MAMGDHCYNLFIFVFMPLAKPALALASGKYLRLGFRKKPNHNYWLRHFAPCL